MLPYSVAGGSTVGTGTVEEHIGERLRESGGTLATAESCSGGLIADRITNVPGCSDYFLGGVVAYSNAAKTTLLGVDLRSRMPREQLSIEHEND